MTIGGYYINGYFINGNWWLLMVIGGYFTRNYRWIFYAILL